MIASVTYLHKYFLVSLSIFLFFSCTTDDIINKDDTFEGEEAPIFANPENPEALPIVHWENKETILAYFDKLIENEQVIVGQHCGDGPKATASYYDIYVDMLADHTGRHVGIVGADFGWFSGNHFPVETLIKHASEGGLVTVN